MMEQRHDSKAFFICKPFTEHRKKCLKMFKQTKMSRPDDK